MKTDKSILLIYHDIYRGQVNSKIPRSASMYHVSESVFLEHVDIVKSSGMVVATLGDLMSGADVGESLVFTFDDGWAGIYNFVLPLFKELGWLATVFITRDFIDRPGFLTKSQVVELSKAGMEIGVHGTTHRMLSACTAEEIYWELFTCKDFLEDLTGLPVIYASLPGGDETPMITAIARQLGVKAVCTSRVGINFPSDSNYMLKRLSIRSGTKIGDIKRYTHFSIAPDKLRAYIFQVPHSLLGGRYYTLLRRWILGERKNSDFEIFKP